MTSIVSEIKDFLAHGRTSDALSRLLELSQSNKQIHDSILMVLAEFNDLNSARLRGTIHNEEATLRQNKINEKVLMALDSFDSQGRVLPGIKPNRKKYSLKTLLIIGLCTTGLGFAAETIALRIMDDKDLVNIFVPLARMSEWLTPLGLFFLGIWAIAILINIIRG